MRSGNVFAEYYLAFKQAVLLAFGERGEARERVHPCLFDQLNRLPLRG